MVNSELDFYFMINPYFPTKEMIGAINKKIENLLKYYPSNQKVIAEKIKKLEGIDLPLIAVNGSCEAIRVFMQNFAKLALVTVPNFNEYEISNHVPIAYNASTEEIRQAIRKYNVDTVVFCNPNNPTGYYREDIELLASEFNNVQFVVDICFLDFVDTKIPDIPHGKNIILIKSLGKTYGICGIRLGYIASENKELIKQILDKIPIWNVNSVSEALIDLIITNKDEYEKSRIKIIEGTRKMYELLKTFDFLTVYPTRANFVMVKSKKPLHFEVKCCDNKTGLDKTYYRIAYNGNYKKLRKLME
ncbi:aminotransferase class I/II-fold pyridoxal phosphate-dependent enzyme [Candidatus Woesearchaeota archaeon]|nr:aminotransferase class I/II-fold pyridoxal phosphate-dependent enzyme [Candidatus Woesearchaeota archaeon]